MIAVFSDLLYYDSWIGESQRTMRPFPYRFRRSVSGCCGESGVSIVTNLQILWFVSSLFIRNLRGTQRIVSIKVVHPYLRRNRKFLHIFLRNRLNKLAVIWSRNIKDSVQGIPCIKIIDIERGRILIKEMRLFERILIANLKEILNYVAHLMFNILGVIYTIVRLVKCCGERRFDIEVLESLKYTGIFMLDWVCMRGKITVALILIMRNLAIEILPDILILLMHEEVLLSTEIIRSFLFKTLTETK